MQQQLTRERYEAIKARLNKWLVEREGELASILAKCDRGELLSDGEGDRADFLNDRIDAIDHLIEYDLEDRWIMRDWTPQDYQEFALACKNCD